MNRAKVLPLLKKLVDVNVVRVTVPQKRPYFQLTPEGFELLSHVHAINSIQKLIYGLNFR